jgi:predicted O-linked N-acetylglucosamine transferase (SPINDLY family)
LAGFDVGCRVDQREAKERIRELEQSYRTAVAHHKAGRLGEARALYEQVLRDVPDHPAVLHMLGVLLHAQGDHLRSIELIGRAIARRSDVPAYHNNLGNSLRALLRLEEAEQAYRTALRLRPDYASALHNLGVLLADAGRLEHAEACLSRCLALAPRLAEAHLALAGVRVRMGRLVEAEASCRKALRFHPQHAAAYFDLGNILREQGRVDEAIASFQRVIRFEPKQAGAYTNLGALLQVRGELDAARASFRRAIELDPHSAQAHFNLARLLDEIEDLEGARVAYERAAALGPALLPEILCHLAIVRRKLCDWRNAEAERAELLQAVKAHLDDPRARRGLPPLTLNLFAAPAPLRRAASEQQARGIELACREARERAAFARTRLARDRLRIGYVSPDFRQHAVGTLVAPLFEHHDRAAFEVFAYALVDVDDAFNRRVRAGSDVYVDASRQSPAETARRIHADQIDVLIDLAGYTTYSRTSIFALRPAPVQAHWLGYLDTLGAPFLPYILADACVIPEASEPGYSEAIVRLPDCFAVAAELPIAPEIPTRAACGLPEDGFVYCSMNGFQKLDPRSFACWMRILEKEPDSLLWLYDGTSAAGKGNLLREATRQGVDPSRIHFAPRLPVPEYLARYRLADLFLDHFDYNAGATALGALSAGLPLLTCPGESFVSRMGASFCAAAGLPELVCASEAEYEERAVALARDRAGLRELRLHLERARSNAPLFDVQRFVRHLEGAYRMMWRDHVDAVGPRHLRVPAASD